MDELRMKTKAGVLEAKQPSELFPAQRRMRIAGKKFHFIGAGGIGMSGLAKVLMKNNAIITGSDQERSPVIAGLNQGGADIKIGHRCENLTEDVDAIVISAAIKNDNAELSAARSRNLEIYKYAQMLGRIMQYYRCLAVCGTHGKSTTSGWLAYLLTHAGLEPSYIIGADVLQLSGSSAVGSGRFFVAEACEYDRSFLNLHPKIAVMLNIEQDHLDYYRDENEIVDAFYDFAGGIEPGGVLVGNGDDANVSRLMQRIKRQKRCISFGFGGENDYSACNLNLNKGLYTFDVHRAGGLLGRTRISLAGLHNVSNSLAVIAAAIEAGVGPEKTLELLPGYTGVNRRMTLKAIVNDITVLDDYAHHPTEIKATLEAVRQRFQPKRIFCVFQPHQHSRTRFLLDDFAESFKLADITIVPEIYFVRDSVTLRNEVNSKMLVEKIRSAGSDAVFIDSFEGICLYLAKNVTRGDLVVTMGAGDIWKVADEYIQWIAKHS
ncbi:MAG: UDP-N-acetylmuramate--L-alanine ligase [Planctomycetota bacterium]